MNKKIRQSVVDRAKGRCEACGVSLGPDSERGHFDHYLGRRVEESVETGWLLCVSCDHERTTNQPSSRHWAEKFIVHCALQALPILGSPAARPYFEAMDAAMRRVVV